MCPSKTFLLLLLAAASVAGVYAKQQTQAPGQRKSSEQLQWEKRFDNYDRSTPESCCGEWYYCAVADFTGATFFELRKLPEFQHVPYYRDSEYTYNTWFGVLTQQDYMIILSFGALLTVVRYLVQNIFVRAANAGIFVVIPGKKENDQAEAVAKFSESAWKLVFYSFSLTWGTYLAYSEGYIMRGEEGLISMWEYMDTWRRNLVPHINLFVMFELGAYFSMTFCHLVLETRRSDFVEMLIHHIVTIMLIWGARLMGAVPVTVVTLPLHDANDVLLEMAKILVYQGKEFMANVWFGAFIFVWVVLRLYYFPEYVIHSSWYHSLAMNGPLPIHFWLVALLCVLVVLHIYWFGLILRTLANIVVGKGSSDVREEKIQGKKKE